MNTGGKRRKSGSSADEDDKRHRIVGKGGGEASTIAPKAEKRCKQVHVAGAAATSAGAVGSASADTDQARGTASKRGKVPKHGPTFVQTTHTSIPDMPMGLVEEFNVGMSLVSVPSD